MGLWDKIRGEFIDIIEWIDDPGNVLVHRFERYNNEIKNGAQLIVREGQVAVFVREGKLADVFNPGTYELKTENLPILSTLAGWKYGFDSPFKAEVYFVSTRKMTDQKWGTKNPVMLRDPEFGPVRLRAFGSYEFRVSEPTVFIQDVVGTDGNFTADEISTQLRNIVVSRFPDALGEAKIPVLDLAANYDELGDVVCGRISEEFLKYGIELTKLLVENISLPEAVEKALDTRSSMGVIGNMQQFQQYQAGQAMMEAAGNEGVGGLAAGGMAAGMGFGMAGAMAGAMAPGQAPAPQPVAATPPPMPGAAAAPPPLPTAKQYHVSVNGQQAGPYTSSHMEQYAKAGQITGETLVWAEGMPSWLPAQQVPELAALFGGDSSFPPPPPPPPPPSL